MLGHVRPGRHPRRGIRSGQNVGPPLVRRPGRDTLIGPCARLPPPHHTLDLHLLRAPCLQLHASDCCCWQPR
jgi:hypothetical protein